MRPATATIALSLASLPFIVPHVVEDFADGIAQRVGLTTGLGACLLGVFLALQSLGLVFVAAGRRAGWWLTFGVGVIWVVGAAFEHGPVLVTGHFGHGVASVVWLAGLGATQAGTAVVAWRGARRSG